MGQLRAPKLVKDMPGFLTSSTERFIKDQNEFLEDEYDTRVSVAFVKDFNIGRKTYDEYKDYYWDKLDLGENDALYIFVCRDTGIDEMWKYGKKYKKLYEGEYTFKAINDNFANDVIDEYYYDRGRADSLAIDGITGTFFSDLEDYFDEVTCPRDYKEYLESLNNQNGAGAVENAVGGIAGLISRIFSTVIGKIASLGVFPTIILIIVIVSIVKKKTGVGNRLG